MDMIDSLVRRYVGLWNEPNAERRRRWIEEHWSEDGAHFSKSHEACGYDRIEARVAKAHAEFVGSGRYLFVPANNAEGHHGGVRFNWKMISQENQRVAAIGFDFFILDSDGRIRTDHQYTDPMPRGDD